MRSQLQGSPERGSDRWMAEADRPCLHARCRDGSCRSRADLHGALHFHRWRGRRVSAISAPGTGRRGQPLRYGYFRRRRQLPFAAFGRPFQAWQPGTGAHLTALRRALVEGTPRWPGLLNRDCYAVRLHATDGDHNRRGAVRGQPGGHLRVHLVQAHVARRKTGERHIGRYATDRCCDRR